MFGCSFDLIYDRFEVYVNDEKSRTFIGMKVHSSANLHSLIRIADKTLAEFDLEHYYEVIQAKKQYKYIQVFFI